MDQLSVRVIGESLIDSPSRATSAQTHELTHLLKTPSELANITYNHHQQGVGRPNQAAVRKKESCVLFER